MKASIVTQVSPKMAAILINLLCCFTVTSYSQPAKLELSDNTPFLTPVDARYIHNTAIRVTTGDINNLTGLNKICVSFDYSAMEIGSFKTEKEFLDDKLKTKGVRKGQKFINEWKKMPEQLLEPGFVEYFNRKTEKLNMFLDSNCTEGPKLEVKVLKEQVERHSLNVESIPYFHGTCTFYEKGQILAQFELTAFGSRENSIEERRRECYIIAAKMVANEIRRFADR